MKLTRTNVFHILFFLVLAFPLTVAYSRGFHVFSNPKIDTLPLTNLGFAIFISLSSVFFSWSRSLDESHKISIKKINKMAARSIMGGMFFIFASFFKYFSLPIYHDENRDLLTDSIFQYVSIICIAVALYMALLTIYDLFDVFISLWEKEYSNKKEDS